MSKKKVHFIILGGTIDSYDKEVSYPLIPSGQSVVPTYIKSLKLSDKTDFTVSCLKDSREITKKDLRALVSDIKKSKAEKIIITCGTFALSEVAKYVNDAMGESKKTIILTGSMLPIYGFPLSDGPFNLGYAYAKAQEQSPGVYVCMNGTVFSPEEATKIAKEGRFVSTSGL